MSGAGKVAALGHELKRRELKRTIVVTGKTLGGSALLEKVTGPWHVLPRAFEHCNAPRA